MRVRALPQHLTIMGALALSLCLLALLTAGSRQAYALGEDYRTGQVIVKLNPIIGATIEEINAEYGSTTLDEYFSSKDIYLLRTPDNKDAEAFAKDLTDDPQDRILYAEPNFVAETPETPEGDARHRAYSISATKGYSGEYATKNLGLSCAAEISRGRGTMVAVLDTGAQLGHPELEANFEGVRRYDFVDKDTNPSDRSVGLDSDGDGRTDELKGHGTHVAGIVDRVAPEAKIMPLRVLNTEGFGDVFTISKAISYARRNGAHVINLSLGSSRKSRLLKEMIENATQNGVVVVAAAGNSGTTSPHYPAAGDGITPASADGLVAVTSVDKYEKKSDFANYGLWVDIAAPGENIRSTFPISMYANWSGTSMATPFVSGQAALIRKVYGSIKPAGIETKIRESARSLLLQDPEYGGMLGAGHADVCASL